VSESALILVLGAPLLVPLAYAVAAAVGFMASGPAGIAEVNRQGLVIYTVFIVALAAIVLGTGVSLSVLGEWLDFDIAPPLATLCLAAAVGVGVALYQLERVVAQVIRRLTGRHSALAAVMEGATTSLTRPAAPVSATALLMAVIVVAEELLWRGVLVNGARESWGLTAVASCALSGGAFGIYHYFFGLRSVAMKCLHGLAWAGLLVLTGSLLVPIVSHLAFNACAIEWRPATRLQRYSQTI